VEHRGFCELIVDQAQASQGECVGFEDHWDCCCAGSLWGLLRLWVLVAGNQ